MGGVGPVFGFYGGVIVIKQRGCGTVDSPKTKIFDREYKLPGYLLKSECLMDF